MSGPSENPLKSSPEKADTYTMTENTAPIYAGPGSASWAAARTATVTLRRQYAAITGRYIRLATVVTFADGAEVEFLERLPKRAAIAAALAHLGR